MLPPEPEDEVVLHFFKCPPQFFNKTVAKHEAKRILADPDCLARWQDQPANTIQREALRAYGIRIPKQLRTKEADTLIATTEQKLATSNPKLLAHTHAMLSILDEIDNPETREAYGFKKPPITIIRQAIHTLEEDGRTIDDLASDIYSVAEKILELRPDLHRL